MLDGARLVKVIFGQTGVEIAIVWYGVAVGVEDGGVPVAQRFMARITIVGQSDVFS